MICRTRSLTRLPCDYMNLFISKIFTSLNRTMNHALRRVLRRNAWLPLVVLRPLLCHNESNMEIQVLLLLLVFQPFTLSLLFLPCIGVMSSEKRGSLSLVFSTRFNFCKNSDTNSQRALLQGEEVVRRGGGVGGERMRKTHVYA